MALRFRLQLRYLVICAVVTAAVITAALFFYNITSFKNAAKESPACPDNINKFILFLGKYHCFSVSIYKFIFILSRNPFLLKTPGKCEISTLNNFMQHSKISLVKLKLKSYRVE